MTPWAVGLMTGTVLDGNIDVALLRTDGENVEKFGPAALVPYPDGVPALIEAAMVDARAWNFEGDPPASFAAATAAITDAQSDAVAKVLADNGISHADVMVVGFHGQTVLHRAPSGKERGRTLQLGDGARMAARLGIDVVADLRSQDVAAGGQGAPLAPVYHAALLSRLGLCERAAMLNLGGVGNVTACGRDRLVGFDTGPANAPINDWVRAHTGNPMDTDGALAAVGRVDEDRLSRLLEHPYFHAAPPKSLDRFDFEASAASGLSLEDGAASLAALCAGAVACALPHLPIQPQLLVACGGGRKNPSLMAEIARRTGLDVRDADTVGLRGDMVEAECFGFLAVRSLKGLPISFPSTTGVPAPQTGGTLFRHAA